MKKRPASLPKNVEALKRAILNVAFTRGISAPTLLRDLRQCGAKISALQLQALLDHLIEHGKMFTTRTMKQTHYHTTVARRAGRMDINGSLLTRIIDVLRRLGKSETAQRMAQLLSLPFEVVASHLDYASVTGEVKARNVYGLRVYDV